MTRAHPSSFKHVLTSPTNSLQCWKSVEKCLVGHGAFVVVTFADNATWLNDLAVTLGCDFADESVHTNWVNPPENRIIADQQTAKPVHPF